MIGQSNMSEDRLFGFVLLALFAILLPISAYHRVRSQATGEPLDRRQEGLFILATLRPVGMVTAIGVVAFLVSPASMAWASIPVPESVRWTAVGLAIVAGALWIWTFQRLGPNLTDTVVTRREHTLVVQGPYRWVRHPFYDAVGLFLISLSVMAANWFLLVGAIVVTALLVLRTPTEEAHLQSRFGDSYRAYKERTGRFVPRLRQDRRGG